MTKPDDIGRAKANLERTLTSPSKPTKAEADAIDAVLIRTKPDDIPESVWDAQTKALEEAWDSHDAAFNPLSNSISDGLWLRFIEAGSRAIMAERAACAQVIASFPENLGTAKSRMVDAIRNRGA